MKSITSISHLRWLFSPLWVAGSTKGGMNFLARRAVGLFSDARRAVVWF